MAYPEKETQVNAYRVMGDPERRVQWRVDQVTAKRAILGQISVSEGALASP